MKITGSQVESFGSFAKSCVMDGARLAQEHRHAVIAGIVLVALASTASAACVCEPKMDLSGPDVGACMGSGCVLSDPHTWDKISAKETNERVDQEVARANSWYEDGNCTEGKSELGSNWYQNVGCCDSWIACSEEGKVVAKEFLCKRDGYNDVNLVTTGPTELRYDDDGKPVVVGTGFEAFTCPSAVVYKPGAYVRAEVEGVFSGKGSPLEPPTECGWLSKDVEKQTQRARDWYHNRDCNPGAEELPSTGYRHIDDCDLWESCQMDGSVRRIPIYCTEDSQAFPDGLINPNDFMRYQHEGRFLGDGEPTEADRNGFNGLARDNLPQWILQILVDAGAVRR